MLNISFVSLVSPYLSQLLIKMNYINQNKITYSKFSVIGLNEKHARIQKIPSQGVGRGPEILFKSSTYFTQEGRTDLSREAIGPEGSNCFSREVRTIYFLRKHVATCDFPGGLELLSPLLDSPTGNLLFRPYALA